LLVFIDVITNPGGGTAPDKSKRTLAPEYAAALFDGEGAAYIERFRRRNKAGQHIEGFRLVCSITMREQDLIAALQKTFGGSLRLQKPRHEGHSLAYRWTVVAKDAAAFLRVVWPHLWAKKAQAKLGLQFQDAMNRSGRFQRGITEFQNQKFFYLRMKHLNRKGVGK
jgi:hypothetical protein